MSPKTGSFTLLICGITAILILIGRLFDFVLSDLHLPLMLCALSLAASLFLGGVQVLKTRVGLSLLGMIFWMLICVPSSIWVFDSLDRVMTFAFYSLMLLPIAAGPRSLRDIKVLLMVVSLCCLFHLIRSSGGQGAERLAGDWGTFANAEDLGLIAGFSLPILFFLAGQTNVLMGTIIRIASALFLFRAMALTGSRAAMLALVVTLAVYFFRSKGPNRLLVLVSCTVGMIFILATIPSELRGRLATVFDAFANTEAYQNSSDEAILSARGRRDLLEDSIRISFTHPLFGVGPGQFAAYRVREDRSQGVRADWLVTHNAYTQVSSEAGLPALGFFLAYLIFVYKTLLQIRRQVTNYTGPDATAVKGMVLFLELSLVNLMVISIFLSVHEYFFWYLMGGLVLALERVVNHRMTQPDAAPIQLPAASISPFRTA